MWSTSSCYDFSDKKITKTIRDTFTKRLQQLLMADTFYLLMIGLFRKVDWARMNYILGHQALREELFGLHFVREVGSTQLTIESKVKLKCRPLSVDMPRFVLPLRTTFTISSVQDANEKRRE
jgi:hypothetical protein